MPHVVVIGAGQAGAAVAALLRAQGHAGPITLIGEESVPPYQRPPLSKGYLLGENGQFVGKIALIIFKIKNLN